MHRRALIPLLAAAALAGCGDDEPDGRSGAGDPATTFAQACRSPDPQPAERLAGLAGYPAEGSAGLVHAQEVYRPGARVRLLPVNRTKTHLSYGAAYDLERRAGGGWVSGQELAGELFAMYRGRARPGASGAHCTSALVPTTAAPGRYRVTQAGGNFRAEFTVTGDPLPMSDLERSLRETEDDPERETTVPEVEDNPSGTGSDAPEPGLQAVP